MPRFLIRDDQGERSVDIDADSIKIGRSKKCQIVVYDHKASREHCEVRRQEGHWLVLDLKSRNGTTVNGAALTERALIPGDKIGIGNASIVFHMPLAAPAPPPTASPSKPSTPPGDRCYLLFEEGDRKGDFHVLDQLSVTIGRGKSNAIHFADEKLSVHHAEIVLDVEKGRYYIIDHHSTNGTKVNGTKVPRAELANGSVIELGAQRIVFKDPRIGPTPKAAPLLRAASRSEADTDVGAVSRLNWLARVAMVVVFLGGTGAGVAFVWKKIQGPGGEGGAAGLDPPEGSRIVRNHSFEEAGGAGTSELVGWKVIAHASGRISREAKDPPHGKRGVLLHASEPGSADGEIAVEYDETFDVERGAVYEARAWVRTSECRGLAGLRATWIADGQEVGATYSPLVTGDEDWRIVKAALLPPRRAKQVRIACVALGRFGDASFDEVQLIRRATTEADRPLVLRLGTWDIEVDSRGCVALIPSGEAEKGEAVWEAGLALFGAALRASQSRLLVHKGYPKRSAEGQDTRGRMIDLETGLSVPLSASLAVAGPRATLSYVAEVPEAASSARVAFVASLRGVLAALSLDGGAKGLGDGEVSGVTRIDWTAGPSPLVLTFKNAVTVRASERGGVTELACMAAERAATLTVTFEDHAAEEEREVESLLGRAERAYAEGRPGEAYAVLRDAVARFPGHEATLSTARPRLTELEAEAEGELAEVEQAALVARDVSRARSLLGALSKRWLGTEWERRGADAVAAAEVDLAVSGAEAAAREEAEKLVSMGENAIAEEKWLLAKVYGKNLIEKFPGTPWEAKGKDLVARSDAGQERARARDAWIQDALTRARHLAANGKKAEARAVYEEVLAKYPKHPLAEQAMKELAALR